MAKIALQRRERLVITWGAVVILLGVLYQGTQGPIKKYRQSIVSLAAARQRVDQMRTNHDMIVAERGGQEALHKIVAQRQRGFDLFAFIKGLNESDLKGRADISSLPARAASANLAEVQLTMTGVSLSEFVNFLYKVYASKNLIAIPYMDYLRLATDGQGLECRLTFVSPRA